jgi:transposase-like protein
MMGDSPLAPGVGTLTPVCPACGSQTVTTASKTVTPESYWRCHACGEVWNDARRTAAGRYKVRHG